MGEIMDIQSKQLASQELNPDTIISFPWGLPGFEDQTRFRLFHQEGSEIVYWLQAVDNDDLVFSVAHPTHFNINYSFVLTDEEEALLQVTNSDDLLILIVLHKDEQGDSGKPTIKGSIKSPLVINSDKRIGLQKVLVNIEQSITLTEKASEIAVSEA
jgi:flagellar assembly factor FliW